MPTVKNIIKRSMRVAGVISQNETPSSDEFNDALEVLNGMLASWSNETLLVRSRVTETFPLTSAISYTIGAGGDFNTTVPLNIISATVRIANIDYAINEITDEQYNNITLKTVGGVPDVFSFNGGYPLATIKFYPAPTSATRVTILSEKAITSLGINDNVDFASGWDLAVVYNLAELLLPEYGQPVTQELVMMAKKYKGNIARSIAKNRTISLFPNMGRDNIFTGWTR